MTLFRTILSPRCISFNLAQIEIDPQTNELLRPLWLYTAAFVPYIRQTFELPLP